MTKNMLLIYLMLSAMSFSCESVEPQVKPNIVLINVDDLGWKDLGFMGSKYYHTPHIDQLAKLGMSFTNGYAAAANCAPSRASLMTGKWPTSHGIYTVGSSKRGKSKHRKLIPIKNRTVLAKKETVLPQVLKANKYKTIHAGKWHLSTNPLDFGFDINIGGGANGHPKSYLPPYGNIALEGDMFLTDLIVTKTLQALDTISQPFFLNYAPYAVHTPIVPIDSMLVRYKDKTPWNGQGNAAYATMVENLDRNIGMLLNFLKQQKLLKHTLIIFTSDNGGLYGITKQHPLRAGKGSYYEGGIREPFCFVWENEIKANTISDVPVTQLDIFPTLLSLLDISSKEMDLAGSDLSQILKGQETELDRSLYWHFPVYLEAYNMENNENRDSLFRTRPGAVIRDKEWKLHYYFENNEMELYNLDKDIGERNNLILVEKEKARTLLAKLQRWWQVTDAPIPKDLNPEYED